MDRRSAGRCPEGADGPLRCESHGEFHWTRSVVKTKTEVTDLAKRQKVSKLERLLIFDIPVVSL